MLQWSSYEKHWNLEDHRFIIIIGQAWTACVHNPKHSNMKMNRIWYTSSYLGQILMQLMEQL